MEKRAIMNALEECNWIQAQAARQLGITERMIGYKIKKYGIATKEVTEDQSVYRQQERTEALRQH